MKFLSHVLRPTAVLAIGGALFFGFVTAGSAQAAPVTATQATQHTTQATLHTILTGAQEVPPGSGDPNGIGVAVLHLTSAGQVDFVIAVAGLSGTVTAVHVHNAPAGQRGSDEFDLGNPVNGFAAGTLSVDPAITSAIIAHPENYYVEVHTTAFPAGALRGQL